jgi:hypothetical protein
MKTLRECQVLTRECDPVREIRLRLVGSERERERVGAAAVGKLSCVHPLSPLLPSGESGREKGRVSESTAWKLRLRLLATVLKGA